MFNKIVMIGNLTRDVELRYTPSGVAVATIGLASNRRYKKQDGSLADDTCFIDVKLFGRTAEVANQYLRKGSKVLIEGRLTYEAWTDQMGNKRSRHTIAAEGLSMLDSKNSGATEGYGAAPMASNDYNDTNTSATYPSANDNNRYAKQQPQKDYVHSVPEIDIDEDELPF
ncbi:single-stranded DNA-binding protein [Helicobacter sp. faydin-H20]|uniref:single-stranded DNA-binding protein n=1 Tax=Helicobacter anatolicus TaxID=2905874 RepID=UPI001E2BDD86|nr:single-stranded DNA-binding protein [Helicobacter anatolicus]MCE3037300.1 single-stranded DNA-binding protein [Helicobacter anatolicus]